MRTLQHENSIMKQVSDKYITKAFLGSQFILDDISRSPLATVQIGGDEEKS